MSTQILESLEFAYRSLQTQVHDQRSSPNLQRYQSMTKQELFVTAIHQAKPWLTTKTYKRGGKAVIIPEMLTPAQQESFAIRWLIVNSRQLSRPSGPTGQPMSFCLGKETLGLSHKPRTNDGSTRTTCQTCGSESSLSYGIGCFRSDVVELGLDKSGAICAAGESQHRMYINW